MLYVLTSSFLVWILKIFKFLFPESSLSLCTNATSPIEIQNVLESLTNQIIGKLSKDFRSSLVSVRTQKHKCDEKLPNAHTILILQNHDKMICPPPLPFIDTSFSSDESCSKLPEIEEFLLENGEEISVSLLNSKSWITYNKKYILYHNNN